MSQRLHAAGRGSAVVRSLRRWAAPAVDYPSRSSDFAKPVVQTFSSLSGQFLHWLIHVRAALGPKFWRHSKTYVLYQSYVSDWHISAKASSCVPCYWGVLFFFHFRAVNSLLHQNSTLSRPSQIGLFLAGIFLLEYFKHVYKETWSHFIFSVIGIGKHFTLLVVTIYVWRFWSVKLIDSEIHEDQLKTLSIGCSEDVWAVFQSLNMVLAASTKILECSPTVSLTQNQTSFSLQYSRNFPFTSPSRYECINSVSADETGPSAIFWRFFNDLLHLNRMFWASHPAPSLCICITTDTLPFSHSPILSHKGTRTHSSLKTNTHTCAHTHLSAWVRSVAVNNRGADWGQTARVPSKHGRHFHCGVPKHF